MNIFEDDTDDVHSADELPPGTELMLGQYQITRYLNSGGFGITYLAKDSLDRSVVIKECFPRSFCRRNNMLVQARTHENNGELRSIVRLFTHEARALSKLRHPFIVGVHQVFEDNNTAYMALDYVEGHDLLAVVEQKVLLLRPDQITAILQKTLDAIKSVHACDLLHRDIAPDNIILTNELNPVLIDFGAAREQATKATRALSALRVVKDGYSPQEFYIAGSEQGPYSDLYSLAATFYHLITGELPPDSQVRIATHVAGSPDPYIPLELKTSDYSPAFCSAIDKAMAILPKDRIQSADEWLTYLAQPSKSVSRTAQSKSRSRQVSSARNVSRKAPARPAKGGKKLGPRLGLLIAGGSIAAGAAFAFPYIQSNLMGETTAEAAYSDLDPGQTQPAVASAMVEAQEAPPAAIEAGASVEQVLTSAQPDTAVTPPKEVVATPAKATPSESMEAGIILQDFVSAYAGGQVAAGWSVDLPFTVDTEATVTEVTDAAPAWLKPGMRITEANGVAVSTSDDLADAIRNGALEGNGVAATIALGAIADDGAPVTGSVDADIVYSASVLDRYRFDTKRQGADWQTVVTHAPADEGLGDSPALQPGDIVVAILDSGETIGNGASVARAVGREIEAGKSRLQFAVNRDGLMWIVDVDMGA